MALIANCPSPAFAQALNKLHFKKTLYEKCRASFKGVVNVRKKGIGSPQKQHRIGQLSCGFVFVNTCTPHQITIL